MNFNNQLTSPSLGPSHPSYYYSYRRARSYERPLRVVRYLNDQYTNKDARVSTPTLGPDDGPQTVEDLIEQGYFAVPKREAESAVLLDRQDTSWLALDGVLAQVRDRHEIYRKNMLEIEWGKCYAFNELARQGWPAPAEQHAIYQKRLHELHADQRAERIRFWLDVSRLRQLIPPSAQQYLSSVRKTAILGLDRGDPL
jgi:hypothetical protein